MHQGTDTTSKGIPGPAQAWQQGALLWPPSPVLFCQKCWHCTAEKVNFNLLSLSNHPHCAHKDRISLLGSPVGPC